MSYQRRADRDELRIRFYGVVTHHDIVDCCVDMAADPGCQDLSYAVIDFSTANSCSFPPPDLELIARASCRLLGSGETESRVLFIAPDGEHRSRFLGLGADGRVEVCGTHTQARAHLEALRTVR